VLFVAGDRLLAIARLGHHLHVGLLVHHGGESVAHHRMIVRQNDADPAFHHRRHQAARFAMRTLTRVPCPGWLSICHSPPIAPARWRMLESPKPCRA